MYASAPSGKAPIASPLALFLASPAYADRISIHADPTPADAWFARVEIVNTHRPFHTTVTLDTAHGPVSITYTSTPNVGCDEDEWRCADIITVTGLPNGVIAVPMDMLLLEDSTAEIFLFEYLGG